MVEPQRAGQRLCPRMEEQRLETTLEQGRIRRLGEKRRKKVERRAVWRKRAQLDIRDRRRRSRTLNTFLAMMKDATWADWKWFGSFNLLRQRVYLYHHQLRKVEISSEADVGWPIIWALGRYNRKHVLVTKRSPSLRRLAAEVANFGHKIWLRCALKIKRLVGNASIEKKQRCGMQQDSSP